MKSAFIEPEYVEHVLYALTPENRLVCRVALATGLRISDILSLKTCDLRMSLSVTESKTGKRKSIRLPKALFEELKRQAGIVYVFEGRNDPYKHRTRQAVYADIKRAAKAFRVKCNLSPHSLRKVYAVQLYRKYGDIEKVRKALNHDNTAVTMIYALADILQSRS